MRACGEVRPIALCCALLAPWPAVKQQSEEVRKAWILQVNTTDGCPVPCADVALTPTRGSDGGAGSSGAASWLLCAGNRGRRHVSSGDRWQQGAEAARVEE